MRRPWIKIETATPDKPEICTIANRLKMDEDMVVGKLIRLWSWVALNRVDGRNLGVTLDFIDKLVSRKGFAAALCHAGWLENSEGHLSLPNFDRHNSDIAKTRALTSQRVARHRVAKSLELLKSNTIVTEKSTLPSIEQDRPSESEAITEERSVQNELPPELETSREEASAFSDGELADEDDTKLKSVLSINAIPTFKPLHSESALAEAMAIEEPDSPPFSIKDHSPDHSLPSTDGEQPPQTPMPLEETPESLPIKKPRRKAESEDDGQPMLF